jgi:hypothetical protein
MIGQFLEQRQDADPVFGYAAILWTLINTAEFVSNH